MVKKGLPVIAYDKNPKRIKNISHTKDIASNAPIIFTPDADKLKDASYFVITVPTVLNEHHVPDLFPIKDASKTIGKMLKKDDTIIMESTVFPGATEEIIIPLLEEASGLKSGRDFFVCYSPERFCP